MTWIIIYIVFAVCGLFLSPFMNILIRRLPRDEKVFAIEYCPQCTEKIGIFRLFPVFSYIITKGRYACGHKRLVRELIVELLNPILWLVAALRFSQTVNIYYALIVAISLSVFLMIFCSDLEALVIPDSLNITLAVLAMLAFIDKGKVIQSQISYLDRVIGLIGAMVVFLAIYYTAAKVFKREALGGGDVKFLVVCGFLLGWRLLLLTVLIASVSGAIILLIIRAVKKDRHYKEYPFAPMLTAGAAISILFGGDIINRYIDLFM